MIQWTPTEISRLPQFLGKAQALGISDIHINPTAQAYRLRVRHMGLMCNCQTVSQETGRALVQRIKAQAQLNLAETRCPQDGRIEAHKPLHREVRVASHPTLHGENLVIRLFAPQQLRQLDQLGIGPETQRRLSLGLETEEGLILVCGPTGAGKTSTLHALLHQTGSTESNLMTLEDPVEITLEGALQTDLSQLPKLDFAGGLKSLLRQDPDVMLVGEIRDRETAELAIEAAMTGHLVMASLHAADTTGALTRLDTLGIHPNRILPHLRNLICQRLIRTQQGNKRVAMMQIWTPHLAATAVPEAVGDAHEVSIQIRPPALWRFSDCLNEALQHGLIEATDRPSWLRESQ